MECPICASVVSSENCNCSYCGAELLHSYGISLPVSMKKDHDRFIRAHWGRRFISNFIDLSLLAGALTPACLLSLEHKTFLLTELSLFLLLLLLLFQMAFLMHDHQTIGKKVMGLAIVCNRTGDAPNLGRLLFMRHLVPWTFYCVPFLAPFMLLLNGGFFLLTKERGLHDIISNTEVVRA